VLHIRAHFTSAEEITAATARPPVTVGQAPDSSGDGNDDIKPQAAAVGEALISGTGALLCWLRRRENATHAEIGGAKSPARESPGA
jgi:hypothetical protein